MSATKPARATEPPPPQLAPGEQRLILSGVTWEQYETLRATLDDFPGLRMTYLEGELEIMSPSIDHEGIKTTLARLLEIYALERDLPLNGYGSTTFRKRARERGLEPDECYCLGRIKEVPDIAIEVALSSGGIDKLEVYRGLDVPEVWIWKEGRLSLHRLEGERYRPVARSRFLPDLDLEQLVGFVGSDDQTAAVRAYRNALRR
jgi:Uma2 family endonuclease